MTYESLILSDAPSAFYRFEDQAGSGVYLDSSPNNRDIATLIDSGSIIEGIVRGSEFSRFSSVGLPIGFTHAGISGFSAEVFFQAGVPGTYYLLDAPNYTTGIETRAIITQTTPGVYVLKFGFGIDAWSFTDTPNRHVQIHSTDVTQLFDGKRHHIVFAWSGTTGSHWAADQLTIYVDGIRKDDITTGSQYIGVGTQAPITLESFYIAGRSNGTANPAAAVYDEFALYPSGLTEAQVRTHYNNASALEPAVEVNTTLDPFRLTNGILETVYEANTTGSITQAIPALIISATSFTSVVVGSAAPDTLASRVLLADDGSLVFTMKDTDLETGEPNSAGHAGTRWYEIPFDKDEDLTARVQIIPAGSVGYTLYKQPSLDLVVDDEDETTDEFEPSFGGLVAVPTDPETGLFELDQDYDNPYFLQVGTDAGGIASDDSFTLVWGGADPGVAGSFARAVEVEGPVGARLYLSNENAWIEPGEPDSPSIDEVRSMWIRWYSPADPIDVIFYISGPINTAYAAEIYTGTGFGDLALVASGARSGGSASIELPITTTPNAEYLIRVATTSADPASIAVNWGAPRKEYESNEPVNHLRVTVHAGVKGGWWNGTYFGPNELMTDLPNRTGAQFQEALNVPGSGSITVLQNDPIVRAFNAAGWPMQDAGEWDEFQVLWSKDPFDLFRFGNFVKFWMNDTCVSGFIVKNREINVIGSGEEADRTITVSGPTVHALLNDFIVEHVSENMMKDERMFSWASVSGAADNWDKADGWFDSGGTQGFNQNRLAWNHPINADAIDDPPGWKNNRNEAPGKRPKYALKRLKKRKWPDEKAKWLWMGQNKDHNQNTSFPPERIKIEKQHYYRTKAFNLTKGTGYYRFTVHSDTSYVVYLDGEEFMVGNGNENYTKYSQKSIWLEKGDQQDNPHTIAVKVQDTTAWVKIKGTKKKKKRKKKMDIDHNDAFIMTVQRMQLKDDGKSKVKDQILRSNKMHWFAWHGPNPPGWSRAMILNTIIREARDRQNESAMALVLQDNFGKISKEGTKWYDTKQYNGAVEVGMTALDLQQTFSETLKFDVWVNPDNLEVCAWQGSENGAYPRGVDRTKNVALVAGSNLINWTVSEEDNIRNYLLVKTADGWTYAYNDKSMERYGNREGMLELGGLHDEIAASELAEALMTSLLDTSSMAESNDIVGHRNETYAGSIIPVKGAVPFLDWNVGDTISAPSSNGALRPHRVLSLTCTEDQDGNLVYDPELAAGTFEYSDLYIGGGS